MRLLPVVCAPWVLFPIAAAAGMEDDPLLTKLMIDQLEWRGGDDPDPLVLEAEAWIGRDLNKLWLKSDLEYVDDDTEEAELQLLYSRAVAPFWDLQLGWRRDIRPNPIRDWFAMGFKGVAPYWFEVDAAVFLGESGRSAARLDAEYELLFTQRLILTPELTLNLHGKDDPDTATGSGLSDLQLGLRLRYEIRPEFAPYIGLNWIRLFGGTADYARAEGADATDLQVVFGLRAWF